jgi:glycosyltransferase involved in cell wall biosynthesis
MPQNAAPIDEPIFPCSAPQRIPRTVRFGIVGTRTSPPCGLARFAASLEGALSAHGPSVRRVGDAPPPYGDLDVVILQHDDDMTGEDVSDIGEGLGVPTIVVVHTIPKAPTSQQRSALEAITAAADQVVVMSEVARRRLCGTYAADRRKVTVIPHGATLPTVPRVKRASRPTILTFGLLRPGNGVERVIDAMPLLRDLPGRPRYVIAGPMDPRVSATEAGLYRDERIRQARDLGVADSVSFDSHYYVRSALCELIQQAAVVVLPFDSTEQACSGVLADAFANGRPIVATAFPHARELLGSGAGMVVEHDDPVALAAALRQIITQPRLAGSLAAEARARAPEVGWPAVAAAYLSLAQRLIAATPRADSPFRDAETTGSRG